jgi:hypothetical protein
MPTEDCVQVYDNINKSRLLGSIYKGYLTPPNKGPWVRMAYCPTLSVSWGQSPDIPITSEVTYVEFEYVVKVLQEDEWSQRRWYDLTTSASLEHLLHIRGFRLPGEDECRAEMRRRNIY